MNEPIRLRDTGGAARVLLGAGKLEVPAASRQRALAFTGVAASVATSGTAVAASATSLVKSVVLCVCLGTVGGGVASLVVSEGVAYVQAAAHHGVEAAATRSRSKSLPPTTSSTVEPFRESALVAAPVPAPPPALDAIEPAPVAEVRSNVAPPSGAGPGNVSGATGSRPLGSSLFDEQRVIESARGAVARGDAASALAILDGYQRSYPGGQFGPEALALRIEALSGKGELGRARGLAADFRQRYPHHPLLGRVQAAVQGPAPSRR